MAACAKKQGARVPVRLGLVAEYMFNEGAGQTLTDYSGNANHGTLGSTAGADTNDPTWTGAGLSFTTDDFTYSPTIAGYVYSSTIVFYTATTIDKATATSAVCSYEKSVTTTDADSILVGNTFGGLTNEIVSVLHKVGNVSKVTAWCSASDTIPIGWHTVTINWNGSSYDIYIDLSKKTTTAIAEGHAELMTPTMFMMGARSYNTSQNYYATISVAYATIYNRALTQAEIAKNYACLKPYLKKNRGISLA